MVYMSKFALPFFFVKMIDSGTLEHRHSWLSETSGGCGALSASRWRRSSECALAGESPRASPFCGRRRDWKGPSGTWQRLFLCGPGCWSPGSCRNGPGPKAQLHVTQAQVDASSASGARGQGGGGGGSVRGAALSGAPPGAEGVTLAPVGLGPQLRGTTGAIGKQRRGRRAPVRSGRGALWSWEARRPPRPPRGYTRLQGLSPTLDHNPSPLGVAASPTFTVRVPPLFQPSPQNTDSRSAFACTPLVTGSSLFFEANATLMRGPACDRQS